MRRLERNSRYFKVGTEHGHMQELNAASLMSDISCARKLVADIEYDVEFEEEGLDGEPLWQQAAGFPSHWVNRACTCGVERRWVAADTAGARGSLD